MSVHLDTIVAQGVFKARLLERVLHDDGPWSMKWSGKLRHTEQIKDAHGVTFRALFNVPAEPESLVELRERNEVVAVRIIPALLDIDGTKPVEISWRIGLRSEDLTEVE